MNIPYIPKPRTDTELLEAIILHGIEVSRKMVWPNEPNSFRVTGMGRFLCPDLSDWRLALGWSIDWIECPDKREELDLLLMRMTFSERPA